MFTKLLKNLHKILGLPLSIVFFLWFASGIVMIYHSFPRASQEKRIVNLQSLPDKLPDLRLLSETLSDTVRLQSLTLEMHDNRPVLILRGKNVPDKVYADSLIPMKPYNIGEIGKIVTQWCTAPVLRVDTVYEPDQWIPFGRPKEAFPIYKYIFADTDRHELYISPKDGKVLQMTDKEERLWAWLGAIPHWVYFTVLRQNQPVWIDFVKWSSGIGTVMCLAGFVLSLRITWKNRDHRWGTPYRKRWYRWHHISGLLFGIFAATFAFSGMMSLMDIPDWLKKAPKEQRRGHPFRMFGNGKPILLNTYVLDYRKATEAAADVKQVEWASWNGHPYYRLTTTGRTINIDASDSTAARPFVITEEMVRSEMRKIYGDSITWKMELITEYDKDYFSRKREPNSLPVYRVIVEDDMHTRHYFNPLTLRQQRTDDDGRTRHLLYRGLHCLDFKFLTDRPWLWNIIMYTLMIGGTFLSLTGVTLTFKWITRNIKHRFHNK